MVASIGAGKALSQVAQSAEKVADTNKTAGMGDAQKLDHLVNQPDSGTTSTTSLGSLHPDKVTAGQAQATNGAQSLSSAEQQSSKPQSLGDRILGGIDKARTEFSSVTGSVEQANAAGAPNISDLMRIQGSMISFEVDVQAGGKSVQETNSGIQTLLKGQ